MASPTPTLPDDTRQDELRNRGEQISQQKVSGSYVDAGLDQLEAFANDPSNASEEISEQESKGTAPTRSGDFVNNVTGNKKGGSSRFKAVARIARKRGGLIGLLGLLGIGGGIMAGVFGPASMVINLMENFTLTNDSSSLNLERRFMKAFGFATVDTDPICQHTVKVKCSMGRISNSALYKLNRQGIVPYFAGSTAYDGKRTGYPTRNPTGYTIDLNDGVGARNIAAKDLPGFLANNPRAASKILGHSGAFNLRVKAWSGKHITNKLYKKFNLNRNGGVAIGNRTGATAQQHRESVANRIRERVTNINSSIDASLDTIRGKAESQLSRSRKGGAGYTIAVAACMGAKAAPYAAGSVAAIQLTQAMPTVMEYVLSPGSAAKATGIGASFTAEDAELIGTTFTERVTDSQGRTGSALDSQILLSAMGSSTGKPAVSQSMTPGLAFLTSVRGLVEVDRALEPTCSTILSPAAMYSAMAVESAINVAAAPTVVGGIAKVVIGAAVGIVAEQVITGVLIEVGRAALLDLAKNNAIADAKGIEFGDLVGVSASSFFAAGGMANNLPVLTEADLPGYAAAQATNEAFHRDMDVATLSPFDTSSRYTFLGSIVRNMQMGVILNNNYTGNISSVFSSLLNFSAFNFGSTVGASSNYSVERCSYAKDFGLETDSPTTTPAISVSGLPCTGLNEAQTAMTTSEALDLLADEGWFNEDVEIDQDDTIDDLMTKGYIRSDTPLTDAITSCGDASTGDYIFNSAGCIAFSDTKDPNNSALNSCAIGDDGKPVCAATSDEWEGQEVPEGVKNGRSLLAIGVFLADQRNYQILNGHDDTESQALKDPTTTTYDTTETPIATIEPPISSFAPQVAKNIPLSIVASQSYDKIGYSRITGEVAS